MTTGTKVFRIIISTILGLTILLGTALFSLLIWYLDTRVINEDYNIAVAGIEVTDENRDDVLGDGTVHYDPLNNVLTFYNANIEYDYSVVYARTDLLIQLIGENKFTMSGEYVPVIYASSYILSKDLVFFGDGSLDIEFTGSCGDAMGIHADNLVINSDITITMPDCENIANGIYCEGSLTITNSSTVTVNHGTGTYSSAVKARSNINIENGSALNVSVGSGSTETCKGVISDGSLIVWDNASLTVSYNDLTAKTKECVNVAGLFRIGKNATVSVTSKEGYAIKCAGSMELNDGATVTASNGGEGADIVCYGAIVNYGATINSEVDAVDGVINK